MPHLPKVDFKHDYYPVGAVRAGIEGRVLVAFDITSAGLAKDVSVLWSENSLLATHTVQLLERAQFKVLPDSDAAGDWRRWRAGFVYCLQPSGQSDEFAIPVQKIYLLSARLPGAPIRSTPDGSSACFKNAHTVQ
jgi:TonB family protein